MTTIPDKFLDLVDGRTLTVASLATIMEDGSPQLTPVWFEYEQGDILINSQKGRLKDKNMRARPEVALLIIDPKNLYRYIQLRGEVVEITEDGAWEHINKLSRKYTGHDYPPLPEGAVRVIYRVRPSNIDAHG